MACNYYGPQLLDLGPSLTGQCFHCLLSVSVQWATTIRLKPMTLQWPQPASLQSAKQRLGYRSTTENVH